MGHKKFRQLKLLRGPIELDPELCGDHESVLRIDCKLRYDIENAILPVFYREAFTSILPTAVIGRLSSCEILKWPPLIIIGCVTYAPLSGVYECPLCSHGPRGPVGV